MSSENKIVNQSGDDHPDNNTESQPVEPINEQETAVESSVEEVSEEPAATPQETVNPEPESAEVETNDLEEDWDSWLLANPETEEVAPEPEPMAVEEGEAYLLGEEVTSDDKPVAEVPVVELVAEMAVEVDEVEPVQPDEPVTESVEIATEVEAVVVDDMTVLAEVPAQSEETVEESVEIAAEIEVVVVEEAVSEADEHVVETPVVSPPPQPRKPKQHPHGLTAKDVIRYFAPCGRCGYFLTGYRAINGEKNFEEAVLLEKNGWLRLSWSQDIRELVLKSYGRVVEANDLLFSNACPECSRVMDYYGPVDDDQPVTFRIEVKPQSSK